MLGVLVLGAPATESTNSLKRSLGCDLLGYVELQLALKELLTLTAIGNVTACRLRFAWYPSTTHLRQRKAYDFVFVALFAFLFTTPYILGSH